MRRRARVGPRARLALLCFALAVTAVPGPALATAHRAAAAAIEAAPALRCPVPSPRTAPAAAAIAPVRRWPEARARRATAARCHLTCTPRFLAHRALLR